MTTLALTKDNFEETVLGNDIVLVDFWAEWCGPCHRFAPVFEESSGRHPEVVYGKVDTEAQPELAGAFQVMSIPSLMIFREQVLVFAEAGALPNNVLEDLIDKVQELDMEDVRRQVDEAQSRAATGVEPAEG